MSVKRQRNVLASIMVVLGIIIIPLAVVSGVASYFSVYAESVYSMRQQNRALVNQIDGWIALKKNLVEYNAMLLRTLDLNEEMARAYFAAIVQANDDVSDVYVGLPNGLGFSSAEAALPPGWIAYERPWYIAAAQRPGEVTFTAPRMDIALRQPIFSVARTIGNDDDNLGALCIYVPFTTLAAYVAAANDMTYSVSFIIDASGYVLLHPDPALAPLGGTTFQNKTEIEDGRYAQMFAAITSEGFFASDGTIYIGTPLATTGWFVVNRVPTSYITSNVFWPLFSIIATGLLAAIALIGAGLLLRAIRASAKREREANELNEIFFKISPLIMNIWDDNYNLVATSQQSVEIFGLTEQKQYIEHFYELSPECQPCGTPSRKKALDFVKQAFSEGRAQFEWMHQTISGKPLPTEITLVRFAHRGRYMVAAYTIDLRPIKAAMEREREAHEMNQIFLNSAPFSYNLWDEDFNLLDAGEQNLKMFGISNKEQYIKHYVDFWPERQPCGTPSMEKAVACMKEAFREGRARFEWLLITKDGEPLPVDITLVRFMHQDKNMLVAYIIDLRPIKEAMQKEHEANEATQLFFNASPMYIEIWNKDLHLVDCNPQTCDLFEVSSKVEYMERYAEFQPARQPCGTPSKELVAESLNKAMQDGYARMEFMHLSAHGEPLPVETIIVRIKLRGEYMLVCYSHDLRPLMDAAEKIREAEKRVQLMLNATPMSICLYDTNLIPIDCNQEALRMFGLPDKESFLDKDATFMPSSQPDGENSRLMIDSLIMKAFEKGWARAECLCEKADGTSIPAEITFVRVGYKEGYAVIEYVRDLTQIKDAIEKEREAEERAKLVLDASPMACYMLDENHQAIDCNQAAIELFAKETGRPLAETYPEQDGFGVCRSDRSDCESCGHRGRASCPARAYLVSKYRYIFPGYDQNKERTEQSMKECCGKALEEGMIRFEFSAVTLYGAKIPCEVTIVPVKYQNENSFAVYIRDLRESKMILAETQRREMAEEESRAKTRFLARMSHEIRTPMNAVQGIAEIQLQKENHSPETEEAFLRIYNSSRLLLTIINDILDLSKVEAGKMEIVPAAYELAILIEDTVQLNLRSTDRKKIDFSLKIDERLPTQLIGDELRIKQILNNLLTNAFKYTQEGLVSLSIDLEDGPVADEVIVIFSVQDTGQGMTTEQIDQLFDVFARFNVQSNRNIEGSGLGMSIAYSFITMMQGEIKVESVPGKGSTFTVRLPQQKIEGSGVLGKEMTESLQQLEITRRPLKKTNKFTLGAMPYGRVLVVDDMDINLDVAEGILTSYEISVETARSGTEAIAKIRGGEKYDIIFMDHMMPGMDGIEAAKIIREMGYDYPIVALTANAVKDSAKMFMSNGFSGFISKPIDIDKLNAYLLRFIRDKHHVAVD